jgi:hypothetical protein
MNSMTDTVQPLQDNDGVGVLSSNVNNCATELVVFIGHPMPLFTLAVPDFINPLMMPIAAAQVGKVFSLLSISSATEEQNFVGRGDDGVARDAQVNANERRFSVTDGWHRLDTDRQRDIPIIATLEQASIATGRENRFSVARRHTQRQPDVLAAHARRNPQNKTIIPRNDLVRINTQANTLRTIDLWERYMLLVLAQAIVRTGQRNSGIDSHACIVGGQTKSARGIIDSLMQPIATTGVFYLRCVKTKLYCLRESISSLAKPIRLALGWCKYLNDDTFCSVHEDSIAQRQSLVKSEKRGAASPVA